MIFNTLLVLLSLPLFVFSAELESGIAAVNTWNISQISFFRTTTVPIQQLSNFSTSFTLHRTIPVPCRTDRGPAPHGPIAPCGWRPSPIITWCSYGYTSKDVVDGWRTCQKMTDMPDGEDEFLPDMQQRLKWRVLDLEESIGETGGAYNGVSKNGRSFKTVTIEVVQALPDKL
jgi:hypothetical protein